jgi:hypothetical protein
MCDTTVKVFDRIVKSLADPDRYRSLAKPAAPGSPLSPYQRRLGRRRLPKLPARPIVLDTTSLRASAVLKEHMAAANLHLSHHQVERLEQGRLER